MFNNSPSSFLFNLVKDNPRYVIAAYVFSFGSAIFSVSAIALLIPILFFILNEKVELVYGDFSDRIRQLLILCSHLNENYRLIVLMGLVVLASLIGIAFAYFAYIVSIKQTQHLIHEMRCGGFNLLSKVDLNYYRRHKTGDILFKINREIDKAALAIKSTQKIIIISITFAIFSLALILISLRLTPIAIASIALNYYLNSWLSKYAKKQELLLSQKLKKYNCKTVDFLTGIECVKHAANESEEYYSIVKSIEAKSSKELAVISISSSIEPINKILSILIVLAISISCYFLYDRQAQVFIPILIVYLLILFKLLPLVNKLKNARGQLNNNRSSIDVVSKFLKEINEPIIKSGTTTFDKLKYEIELHNVTFAYPHHARIVLDKININIAKGNTVALVGSPEAGKSTLVSLLSRLYEPIEGKITIDGRDIAEYDLASLRKAIAVVKEEAFIFNDSILYNLTYGLKNVSKDRVISAAKTTKIYDFIIHLPKGFDSKIGDRGVEISEAQKQLIAITRALLSNPEIVILDEPMKNIGKAQRETVQDAIDKLCRDRTVIAIDNRLAAIEKADLIIILNKGRAIESGTHQELLKNGNVYKKMRSAQFKTSQQSHQQLLAKKISKKLSRQTNSILSSEIKNNLSSLLNYLQMLDENLVDDNLEQEKILDESYQSAKNMLASLREYQRKISRGFKNN